MNEANEVRLAIIIPVYNMSKSISKTVQSILIQNDQNIEIIFIDDGSKDGSIDIVKKMVESKGTQCSFYHQTNSGVSIARNKGLSVAKSEYVLFLDADDLLNEHFFSSIKPFINKYYDLISYKYAFIKNEINTTGSIGITDCDGLLDIDYELENYFQLRRRRMKFHLSSMVFRREFLIENNILFDERLKSGEDSLFVIKAMTLSKSVYNIPRLLFYYVQTEGSTTNSYNLRLLDSFKALSTLSDFFNEMKLSELGRLTDLKSSLLLQVHLYRLKKRAKHLSFRAFLVEIVKSYPELAEELKLKVRNSREGIDGFYLFVLWIETYIFSLLFSHYIRRAMI